MLIRTRRFAASIFRPATILTDPWVWSLRFSFLRSCRIFAIASAGFLLARYARVDVKTLAPVVFLLPLAVPGLSASGHL
jgi:hypothetical protein